MLLGYYRLGAFEDARRSLQQWLTFARRFRLDNPLTKCGSDVYQPNQPVNLTYDAFGPPAAFVRGLFEYGYRADGLVLVPHIPPGITELRQQFPVRWGPKRLYLTTVGQGRVTGCWVNGKRGKRPDDPSVFLPYARTPFDAQVVIALGGARPSRELLRRHPERPRAPVDPAFVAPERRARARRLDGFLTRLTEAGLADTYAAAHARLALDCLNAAQQRAQRVAAGALAPLPEPSRKAADQLYADTFNKLCDGLDAVLERYALSADPTQRKMAGLYRVP
jgi:hypothetical protein